MRLLQYFFYEQQIIIFFGLKRFTSNADKKVLPVPVADIRRALSLLLSLKFFRSI